MSVVEREKVEVLTEREQRARILEAAALEIEVRGWCQGNLATSDGRVCLVGGILSVLGGDEIPYNNSYLTFYDAGFAEGLPCLPDFNDEVAKSADEVTFLLRWRAEEIRDGR